MKRLLGSFLLVTLLLAGCGDDGRASDEPADSGDRDSSSSAPTEETEETEAPEDTDPEWQLVEIVSGTAVGGELSTTPTPIPDAAALADFTSQFERPEISQEMQRVIRGNAVPEGYQLVAAVVSIGCDVPTEVTYADGEVHATKVPNPTPECFAPVTSVAILVVQA